MESTPRTVALILITSLFTPSAVIGQGTVLQFDGPIDGSHILRLAPTQVTWDQIYWGIAEPIVVNGATWFPSQSPTLPLDGPLFSGDLADYYVRTVKQFGRDTVAAEIESDHVLIYMTDTPHSWENYSFQVELLPRGPRPDTPLTALHIRVGIDGSDRIRISNREMQLFHTHWGLPTAVEVNGSSWNYLNQPTLPNLGSTKYLDDYIDFRSATIVRHEARDLAALEVTDNYVDLVFADNPDGGAYYDLSIIFGHYLPGDSNGNGIVDGVDYTSWADNYDVGGGPPIKTWREGDWSGDGRVDGADYILWADHFAPSNLFSVSPVPEPSTFALVGLGALALLNRRLRHR